MAKCSWSANESNKRRSWKLETPPAVALHFAYYNFCRVHSSLRVTPAMEAGVTDHAWSVADLLDQQHAI
jgi:hypothetical protein